MLLTGLDIDILFLISGCKFRRLRNFPRDQSRTSFSIRHCPLFLFLPLPFTLLLLLAFALVFLVASI